MSAESPVFTRQESQKVRQRLGDVARDALERLARELPTFDVRIGKSGKATRVVPKVWVEKFEKIANQVRRDFRLDDQAAEIDAEPAADQDPLGGLRIVTNEAA